MLIKEATPKYELLNEFFPDILDNITYSKNINVIVDLDDLFRKIFRKNIFTIPENKRLFIEEAVSGILSIISHYRNYFYKFKKFTTFYFLATKEPSEYCKSIIPEYKKEIYDQMFLNKEIFVLRSKILAAVESIIRYTPSACFIDCSDYDIFPYVKTISRSLNKNEITIILTNNEFFYSMTAYNIFVLTTKGIPSDALANAQ